MIFGVVLLLGACLPSTREGKGTDGCQPMLTDRTIASATPAGIAIQPGSNLTGDPTATSAAVDPPATFPLEPGVSIEPHAVSLEGQVIIQGVGYSAQEIVPLDFGRVNAGFDFINPNDRWVVVAAANDSRLKVICPEFEMHPEKHLGKEYRPI